MVKANDNDRKSKTEEKTHKAKMVSQGVGEAQ